jgi:hypothetical protein
VKQQVLLYDQSIYRAGNGAPVPSVAVGDIVYLYGVFVTRLVRATDIWLSQLTVHGAILEIRTPVCGDIVQDSNLCSRPRRQRVLPKRFDD